MKSNIDFLKKPEGIYGENILALHAFGFIDPVDEFYSYGYCNCSRASYRKPNPGINPYCSIYHDPIPMHIIRSNIGGKILIEFSAMVVEGPTSHNNSEYIQIECQSPVQFFFEFMSAPISIDDYFDLDDWTFFHFWDNSFQYRPYKLISGGHKVLIKLREEIFVNKDGSTSPMGRYIYSDVTSTATDDKLYSQIRIMWENDVYMRVSYSKTGNYWHIVTLTATFLLSAERLLALYRRFCK
ncbi:uncharacterized protein LOC142345376 [Convolutriloba macropyga]|uniref:uncharacterized protein LOC142345376 n=1 Tax=Convolutriloba macropyga TaxID=536237 RepID=UPI003F51D6BA